MSNILYIASFVLLVLPMACKKGGCNVVPEVNFQRIPFSATQYPKLAGQFGYEYLRGGYRGIIVINSPFDGFIAFDRCSTVNPAEGCAVEINENNQLELIDPCSGATFSITNGTPTNNLARCPLKPYMVSPKGGDIGTVHYVIN